MTQASFYLAAVRLRLRANAGWFGPEESTDIGVRNCRRIGRMLRPTTAVILKSPRYKFHLVLGNPIWAVHPLSLNNWKRPLTPTVKPLAIGVPKPDFRPWRRTKHRAFSIMGRSITIFKTSVSKQNAIVLFSGAPNIGRSFG